jgi:hypothetical protein
MGFSYARPKRSKSPECAEPIRMRSEDEVSRTCEECGHKVTSDEIEEALNTEHVEWGNGAIHQSEGTVPTVSFVPVVPVLVRVDRGIAHRHSPRSVC